MGWEPHNRGFCSPNSSLSLSFPNSSFRRARVVAGGLLVAGACSDATFYLEDPKQLLGVMDILVQGQRVLGLSRILLL
jgi:hypothetical protein